MKSLYSILIFIGLLLGSCNHKNSSNIVVDMDSKLNLDSLLCDLFVQPDSSVDMLTLRNHVEQYPERWRLVFDYLNNLNVDSLSLGKIILSDDVYVNVDQYQTRSEKFAMFESHCKYIDLQYIISGNEYIDLSRNAIKCVCPYDEMKDITFYQASIGRRLIADSTRFFIFFPQDLHRPCISIRENSLVRKIVVKIRID